ncbi:MAG: hypothetical protein Q9M36_09985 [Sulfurovum sp.]|nr:hypothetical protein [Sulfurovum sp.]
MNIKKIPIHSRANLSAFMVNFSHGLRQNPDMNEMSILDLKAHYLRLNNTSKRYLNCFPI